MSGGEFSCPVRGDGRGGRNLETVLRCAIALDKERGKGPHLVVLSAGTGSLAGWAAQQNDLARLSTSSVHRTIPGATHASLINDHVDAAQSSRAIRDVVKAVQRAGG